jgi:hypothetical protein
VAIVNVAVGAVSTQDVCYFNNPVTTVFAMLMPQMPCQGVVLVLHVWCKRGG